MWNKIFLNNNQLSILPTKITQIINKLIIDETSYQINNLDTECKILIFSELKINISNLPINLKEIWLSKKLKKKEIDKKVKKRSK